MIWFNLEGSANHLLHHTIIILTLQHLLYLLRSIVVQVLEAQLFTNLLPSHEFSLDTQSAISHSLSAIIAHLLPPLSALPSL